MSEPENPWLPWVVAAGVLALAVSLFFQTKDPMVLVFGLIVAAIAYVLARHRGRLSPLAPGAVQVRVRCPACRALNPEDAKFCAQCGRAI